MNADNEDDSGTASPSLANRPAGCLGRIVASLGTLLVLLLLVGADALQTGLAIGGTSDAEPTVGEVLEVLQEANIRTCPMTDCEILQTLGSGRDVEVVAAVTGEVVLDSSRWIEVRYGRETAYVHGRTVGRSVEGIGSAFLATLAVVVVGVALAALLQSRWAHRRYLTLAASGNLSGTLVGFGTAAGGFILATALFFRLRTGDTFVSFFGETLVSLGAGVIGAVVAFLLFEVGLRTVDAVDIASQARSEDDRHNGIVTEIGKIHDALDGLRNEIRNKPNEVSLPAAEVRPTVWSRVASLLHRRS